MLVKQLLNGARVLLSVALLIGIYGSRAAAAPFYKGKTLTLVQGRTPGGTGDVRARVAIPYLQKYLPGNPTIVSRYMPGGGGTIASNYMANAAKRDGLTIANIGSSMFPNAILGARGIRYKLKDFEFLGSASPGNPYAFVITGGLNLKTVEAVRAHKGLRFAQRSVGHAMYILDRLIAYVLELDDPKWILGYSSPEIPIAVEKGEADAVSTSVPGIMRSTPHWAKEDGVSIPLVIKNTRGRGPETVPAFPQDRPTLDQFADTELKRALIHFNNAIRPGSGIFFAPKGIPAPASKALQQAFSKVWKDPQFAADYKRATAGEDADPITGEEIEQALRNRPKDPKIMKFYRQLIGAGPLPPTR